METPLRAALVDWLRADPALADTLNSVAEEAPASASPPWLGIAASASADWSAKDRMGREVRVALELHVRGDDPATGVALTRAIEARVAGLPRQQDGFEVITAVFLRARVERRPHNLRSALFEYRFRVLASGSSPSLLGEVARAAGA
jgi:hypothetical protein